MRHILLAIVAILLSSCSSGGNKPKLSSQLPEQNAAEPVESHEPSGGRNAGRNGEREHPPRPRANPAHTALSEFLLRWWAPSVQRRMGRSGFTLRR